MAGEWGSRQELLHPRDSHGRFRNSFKVPEAVIAFLEKFNPKTFPSDQEAANYAKGLAQSDRFGSNRHASVSRFLRGYSTVNADLRAGKTSPEVAEMDKAMRPLPNELILNRVVGPEAFGLTPDNLAGIEEFRGKLIADKGYASTNIGTPMHRDGPSITMVIATPAGTKAIAPWSGGTGSREIILDRDQPFRVTKVQPDGKGGYYMMVAATEKGATGQKRPIKMSNAPQAPAAEVNQPAVAQAPQAPAAPQAPVAPQAPAPMQQAPVRTGRPGRPAGPPPAPRNEPVHAEAIGTGAPSTPVTPVPAAPGTPGQNPPAAPNAPEADLTPDPRIGFKEAYKTADVPVPGQGPRRATYNKAYLDLANRKTNPNDVVEKLDHEIALNDKIIESDRADGTHSGPLPEDNARLKKFSQFIKDHFNLEGAKKKEEPKAAAPKERAPRTPEGFEAPTPEQKAKSEAIKAARAERQKAAGIDRSKPAPRPTPTPEEKAARKERKIEADNAARKEVAKQRKEIRAERRARGEKPVEQTPEQKKAAEVARAASEKRAAAESAANKEVEARAKSVAGGWLDAAGLQESDLTDFQKTGVNLLAEQVVRGKISRPEAARRLRSDDPKMNKIADVLPSALGKTFTGVPEPGSPAAKEAAAKAAKKVAPSRPQIPAKDLTDKGLLQRFEAEIKKDEPDEKRLKELGDELDRRDLETANRVKGLSDDDLLKQFQEEIGKNNLDQEKVDRLGAELDRRDAENAKKEQQVEALVSKGRDFKDAWAEVHGKDPEKLDQEERQSLLDANRRAGETRDQSLRRQYQEALHHQYLDAERVTRGHLLTPEGRRKGVDPKTLFSGNNVVANKWASDELKEYWQTHPRKTFTQFKADMVGGAANKAAAKKVEGVQRDLELGHVLKRAPAKKIAVPGEIEAEYKKTTIAQLRQQAKDANIEVPKNLRLKQDIFDHVAQELAKREQGRRGAEAPKASVPAKAAPKEKIKTWEELGKPQGPSPVGVKIAHEGGTYERLPGEPRRYKVINSEGKDISSDVTTSPGRDQTAEDARTALRMDAHDKENAAKSKASGAVDAWDAIPGSWSYGDKKSKGFGNDKEIDDALTRWATHGGGGNSRSRAAEPAVNRALRGDVKTTPEIQADIDALDRALSKSKLSKDVNVHRGVSDGTHILPADWKNKNLKGVEWTQDGFLPVSGNKEAAEAYVGNEADRGFLMNLKLPKGSSAVAIRDNPGGVDDEGEIVLPRGMKFRVTKDNGVQNGLRSLDVEMVGDAKTAPAKATPERLTPNMAVGKTNVSRLESGQRVLLEKNAKGEWSPATRKTGAVPAELVKRQTTAVNGRQRNRLTFKTDDGQEVTLYRDYPAHQTFWTEESRKASAPKAPAEEKLPPPTKAASAPRRDNTELKTRLKAATSREDARKLITQEKMTVPQLKQLAEEMDIAVTGNKDKILSDIIHWSVGRRLDSAAVSKPGETTSRVLTKAAERPSGPKVSDKPILANHWGTLGGPVNFHADGKLGTELRLMHDNQRLEVPGEDDNVANVIGKLATKATQGDLTQRQLMDEVRKVADKFPNGSPVRVGLQRALQDMGSSEPVDVSGILKRFPEGTPTPIAELLRKFGNIPAANKDRVGTKNTSEVETLQDIMQEWAQGKLTPLSFIGALKNRLLNNRHESEEGKFEIDRAVQEAIKELEALMKKDRKLLYPIERR